jgi:hypothetical protein
MRLVVPTRSASPMTFARINEANVGDKGMIITCACRKKNDLDPTGKLDPTRKLDDYILITIDPPNGVVFDEHSRIEFTLFQINDKTMSSFYPPTPYSEFLLDRLQDGGQMLEPPIFEPSWEQREFLA